MAVAYVKEVGFVTNTTSETAPTITVAAGGVPIDDTVLIFGAINNAGGATPTTVTVTDTRSNTWVTQTPVSLVSSVSVANDGAQGFFAISTITTALLAADTITITLGAATTAKGISAQQFTGVRTNLPILAGSYATTGALASAAVTVPNTTTNTGQALCVLVAIEGPTTDTFTGDSDTTDGTWVQLTERGSGTTTSAMTLQAAYKIVTAPGPQTYNSTISTKDWAAASLVLDWPDGIAPAVDGRVTVPTPTISVTSPSGTYVYNQTTYWEYVVPFAVTTVIVDAYGAQGGLDGTGNDFGAEGARVKCDLTVTPGEILRIYVGGKPTGVTGGFNGGGSAGLPAGHAGNAGSGGGASDVRRTPYALADRVVAAGGGGGGGGEFNGTQATDNVGGVGDTPTGGTGTTGAGGNAGGGGGTSSAGGAGGVGTFLNGVAGTLGVGGAGGSQKGQGGGGGGGRYGGGSGGWGLTGTTGGGGGGGSGLSTGVNETLTSGARTGHGEVTIDFTGELILPDVVTGAVSIPTPTIPGDTFIPVSVVTAAAEVPAVARILLPFPSPVVTVSAVIPTPTINRADTAMPAVVTASGIVNAPVDFLFDHIIHPETVDGAD